MSDVMLTPAAKQWLADKRREAVEIVTGGDAYTESQRRLAWATLTGMYPHLRAGGSGPQPDYDGPEVA